MNTSIIIPGIITAVAPKPTKTQLIEALVERERKQIHEHNVVRKAKRYAAEEKAEAEVRKLLQKVEIAHFKIDLRLYWGSSHPPEASVNLTNQKIKDLQAVYQKNKDFIFDEKETRKKIVEGLKPQNPLLLNEDVAKSLDALLGTIMGKQTTNIEVVDV